MKITIMFYHSVEDVQSFTSVNWAQVASKSGLLKDSENLIWVNAEYGADVANQFVGIRVLIDGNEVSMSHTQTLAGQYVSFSPFGLYVATEGVHTISLEVRALNAGVTVNVRRIRLAIMQE